MLSIFKEANIIHLSIVFNIAIFIAIFINICILLGKSFSKWIIPVIITITFSIFLIFKIKIAPLLAIFLLLTCCNADLLNIKMFVKYNFLVITGSFLIIAFLNLIGIIPNISLNLLGVNKGASLGFVHPNVTGDIVVGIISSMFMLLSYQLIMHKNSLRNKFYYFCTIMLSLIIGLPLYKLTNCRGLLYFEVIVSILLLFGESYYLRHFLYSSLIFLIIIIPSLFLYFDYEYNSSSSFYTYLDNLLSKRVGMQNVILEDYPLHLFQNSKNAPNIAQLESGAVRIVNENYGAITVDNSFVSILEICGIIGIIISGAIILKASILSIKLKKYIICVLILGWIIYDCVSSDLFSLYLISPILYLYSLNSYYLKEHVKGVNY